MVVINVIGGALSAHGAHSTLQLYESLGLRSTDAVATLQVVVPCASMKAFPIAFADRVVTWLAVDRESRLR